MSDLSDFGGGGRDIPLGDKIRLSTPVLAVLGSDTTMLTVASGGGIIQGISIEGNGSGAATELQNIKVTIDGAAERTIDFDAGPTTFELIALNSAVGYITTVTIPMAIAFETSITMKIDMTDSHQAAVMYSVN